MRNKLMRDRIAVAAAAQIALILVVVNIYAHAQRNGRQRPLPAKRPGHQRPAPASAGASTTPAIALDGRGKLWAVLIGVSNYKNLAPEHQIYSTEWVPNERIHTRQSIHPGLHHTR
jgi:hypothetical protein